MSAIEEKRMYGDRREETVAYVATGQGVATVRISGDQVGRFSLAHRCQARDVVTTDGAVVVATDEDVLVGPDPFESLEFGPAVAVAGESDGSILAADEDGTVARYHDDDGWRALGTVGTVRGLVDGFVAAGDGVWRIDGQEITSAGLNDARDVAVDEGAPLVATGDGLYRLGNGWLQEVADAFEAVAASPAHAHAATETELFGREDGEWSAIDLPVAEPVVAVAYGECVYAVTESGTFLVDADPETTADGAGGWRARSLGLPGVTALAVA